MDKTDRIEVARKILERMARIQLAQANFDGNLPETGRTHKRHIGRIENCGEVCGRGAGALRQSDQDVRVEQEPHA